jgi:hypothetical protein
MGTLKNVVTNIKASLKEKAKEKNEERQLIKEKTKEIRRKAIEAGLEEREKQAIRFAKEKQKVYAEGKIKALNNPIQQMPISRQKEMEDWIMKI